MEDKKNKRQENRGHDEGTDQDQALSEALAKVPPEIAGTIKRLKGKADIRKEAQELAQEIHQEAEKEMGEPIQTWLPMCPMPTDLCRVSPFFPLNRRDLGKREYLQNVVVTETPWGSIRYTGPQLSTYEEDCLMALLALLDQVNHRETTEVEGEKTYTYKGPLLPALKLMGLSGGSLNYKRVRNCLKLMHGAILEMEIHKRDSRGKKKLSKWHVSNLLSTATWDEKEKELTVTVNPYFYEVYSQGLVTLIDVLERNKLKSPIAKSLHRFMKSHRDTKWSGHYITLATTLNIDLNQPHKEIRRYIRRAINELVKTGTLAKGSGFSRKSPDVVELVRKGKTSHSKTLQPPS